MYMFVLFCFSYNFYVHRRYNTHFWCLEGTVTTYESCWVQQLTIRRIFPFFWIKNNSRSSHHSQWETYQTQNCHERNLILGQIRKVLASWLAESATVHWTRYWAKLICSFHFLQFSTCAAFSFRCCSRNIGDLVSWLFKQLDLLNIMTSQDLTTSFTRCELCFTQIESATLWKR